ncbi:hypothetical protein IPP75_00510 [Candidatus Saccharibacteria bacterium]|nr:MAG: hypothetical protein IPP75_00510 [Candidatus Saccharibacteria bacterium]
MNYFGRQPADGASEASRWQDLAAREAYSILAREPAAPGVLSDAWTDIETLAINAKSSGVGAYLIEQSVVLSAVKPNPNTSKQLLLLDMALKRPEVPMIVYHFDVPPSVRSILPRYALEGIKNPTPQDGSSVRPPKTAREIHTRAFPWLQAIGGIRASNQNYTLPGPGKLFGPKWLTGYLLSQSFDAVQPKHLPKGHEPILLDDITIQRIARHAVCAEVVYLGGRPQDGSRNYMSTVSNPRYGAWGREMPTGEDQVRDVLDVAPDTRTRVLRRDPSHILSRELARSGGLPWLLPKERQMVDFESKAGRIVLGIARQHMTEPIAAARMQQCIDAEKMIALVRAFSPVDAP